MTSEPIHPGVVIAHVHLKVADLKRALDFYCGMLGFQLKQRYGKGAASPSSIAARLLPCTGPLRALRGEDESGSGLAAGSCLPAAE